MKNITLGIFLITLSFTSSAQNQSVDSLKSNLQNLQKDSTYVNALNNITTSFINAGRFDSAIRYAKPALDLAEKIAYTKGTVMAYYNMAEYNFHIEEYKPGKAFLIKSLSAALQVNDKRNAANNYKALANLFHLQGNFKLEAESKKKFALYNDSAINEENLKQAAAIAKTDVIKEQEKKELAEKEAKVGAESETQKQRIFYISLVVLIVLSMLIIWLLVSRSKLKAKKQIAIAEEHTENEQIELNNASDQKNRAKDTPAFLQKIAEREESLAKATIIDNPPFTIASSPAEMTMMPNNVEPSTGLEKKLAEEKSPIEEVKALEPAFNPTEKTEGTSVFEEKNLADDTELPKQKEIGGNFSTILSTDLLQNFTAKLFPEKIKLTWKTNVEQNMASFELQKSVDNSQFVTIETVVANGVEGSIYETSDFKSLPGKNYYRLKLNDTQNNFIYGPVIEIEVLPATTLTLVCYPTHAKDVIMVTAAGGKLPVLVNIYDTAGKKQFFMEVPPTTTPIYISGLANGTYSVQMKCQGKTILQQLVKKA